MEYITILGPFGSTFSSSVWPHFVQEFGAPDGDESNCIPAVVNADILNTVLRHGGYGALAINSECSGKIMESISSFGGLMLAHHSNDTCPFNVIGAIRLTLNFCLIARHGVSINNLSGIIAHPVALKACSRIIKEINVRTAEASSNGVAARYVAEKEEYKNFAALGPRSAAERFGLNVIEESVESEPAYTTFALIGPKQHEITHANDNEAIVVFSVGNLPGALNAVLDLFSIESLNLSYIIPTHVAQSTYNFVITVMVPQNKLSAFTRAAAMLKLRTKSHLVFGPFPVIPR